MSFYGWLVLAHVLGAFLFVLGHGASAAVVFRLRRERDPEHVRPLLELSASGNYAAYGGLLILLVSGIWAGIDGGHFTSGRIWLWASVGILVIVLIAMFTLASRHYYGWRDTLKTVPVDQALLERQMATSQPLSAAVIGLTGLVAIIWLMVAKPF